MKSLGKISTIILFFFISNVGSSQSISSISLEFAFPDSYDGIIVSPSPQFETNNRSWSIGPTVLLSYGDQIEQRDKAKLTGLHVGYRNYPQGKEEKVSLFYGFDLWAQRVKDEQASQYFDTSSSSFEDITIEQKDNIFQFFVDLGLRLRVSEKISLSQVIGTGLNATFRNSTSPFDDFNDAFFSQDWQLKTGIAFRLN